MSWVCTCCSSANDEENTSCAVCGCDRPADSLGGERETEVIEGQTVFSYSVIFKEYFRNIFGFFRKKGNKTKSDKSKRPPRKPREKVRKPRKSRERVKNSKKERASHSEGDFANPWPEHNIKFDIDAIKSKGFVRSERTVLNTVKGYTFYTVDGGKRFIKDDLLVVLNMAERI